MHKKQKLVFKALRRINLFLAYFQLFTCFSLLVFRFCSIEVHEHFYEGLVFYVSKDVIAVLFSRLNWLCVKDSHQRLFVNRTGN